MKNDQTKITGAELLFIDPSEDKLNLVLGGLNGGSLFLPDNEASQVQRSKRLNVNLVLSSKEDAGEIRLPYGIEITDEIYLISLVHSGNYNVARDFIKHSYETLKEKKIYQGLAKCVELGLIASVEIYNKTKDVSCLTEMRQMQSGYYNWLFECTAATYKIKSRLEKKSEKEGTEGLELRMCKVFEDNLHEMFMQIIPSRHDSRIKEFIEKTDKHPDVIKMIIDYCTFSAIISDSSEELFHLAVQYAEGNSELMDYAIDHFTAVAGILKMKSSYQNIDALTSELAKHKHSEIKSAENGGK